MDVYCQNIFLCKLATVTFAGLLIEDSGMAEAIFNAFSHPMVFSLLTMPIQSTVLTETLVSIK